MTSNIPTPALVFDICVNDSSNDDAFPIRSETSSVNPLLINFADWLDILEKSPVVILKARIKSPIINEITPRNKTIPASVNTKSLADSVFLSYKIRDEVKSEVTQPLYQKVTDLIDYRKRLKSIFYSEF